MEPVPAGDLERHQAHLPGPARHGQRAFDPAHVQDVDCAGAQRDGPADRDGVDQPAVEIVLAVHLHRREQPRHRAGGQYGGHDRPGGEPAGAGPLDAGRDAVEGQLEIGEVLPGRAPSSMRCSGSMECRWVPDRASRASRPQTLSLNAWRSSSPCHRSASRAAAPAGSAATSAPLIAPTEVPTTRSGRMPASDKARSMPTSCAPRIPPPPSTNAVCTRPASPSSPAPNPLRGRCRLPAVASSRVRDALRGPRGWFAVARGEQGL